MRLPCKLRIHGHELSQAVTIEERVTALDGLGADVGTWQTVAATRAHAQPLRGREYFAQGQMQAAVDVRFRLRWRAGITPAMRVVWRGEPHDIQAVIDVEGAREVLELMCTAGQRDGRADA